MKITVENYAAATARLPTKGQHILAHYDNDHIVVYQAYNHSIADYAIQHQSFGGPHYSYNRMSWIKPNFLWMMYRCGWASKENQERVLAIWISKTDFEEILRQAVFSSFKQENYKTRDDWRKEMDQKDVRLQWDPDHDPFGAKLARRAIQLGMKGRVLEEFGKQQIKSIEDITAFVKEQKAHLDRNGLEKLLVPVENVYNLMDEKLVEKINLNT